MARWKKILLLTLAAVLAALATFAVPTIWFKPWSIEHFYARVFLEFALRRPMVLTSLPILDPMGHDFHNYDLDDMSVEFQLREAQWLDRQLEILRSYDRESMSDGQKLSTDVLEWFMADTQAGNAFMFHDYPVNQTFGVQSGLPEFMANQHQIDDAGDAEDYLTRVSRFGVAFDQVLGGLRHREKLGVLPPRFVIEHVLEEMEAFRSVPATQNILYTAFQAKVDDLHLSPNEREDLERRLEGHIETIVYPAYGRLIDYFDRLRDRATDDDGVWKLPDGEAYYAYTLRHHTTTDMSAEQIHQLGLREVDRLQGEMKAILRQEGYDAEDLAATMARLNEDERFLYPDTDAGRARILADYQAIIDEVSSGMDEYFDLRPDVGVIVERVPEFKEETAPGAYYEAAPMDRSRNGTFFANLRSVREIPRFGMRTLAYHEAVPGHHFQITIAQSLDELPFFRRIIPFSAYVEGWALYAERLAAESGYQEDPYDRLGYLTGQLFRANRLVVDTGIHHKRWTRQRAIDYMRQNTGMPETDVVAEVERYIVSPGQACAYMVGELKILELRDRARRRLGSSFDLREFHDVILGNGALPLSLLEREVERWLNAQEPDAGQATTPDSQVGRSRLPTGSR